MCNLTQAKTSGIDKDSSPSKELLRSERLGMSKKKDCFGSETYVCRTRHCPYVGDCVQRIWDKKKERVLRKEARPNGLGQELADALQHGNK